MRADRFTALLKRLRASQLGSRVIKGAFWSTTGAVTSRALSLLSFIVAARILGRTAFGEMGVVQSTVGMFGVLAGFGLGLTATKHLAELRNLDPGRASRILALSALLSTITGALMALGLVILAPWLSAHALAAPHLAGVMRIGALILFLEAVNAAQIGALNGLEAFRKIAQVNFWSGVASLPIIVVGVYGAALPGAVWGLAIARALNAALNHIALRTETLAAKLHFSLRGCMREWPVLWKFSIPSMLGSVITASAPWACNAALANQPNGYAELGIFNAANQWRLAIFFLPYVFNGFYLPIVSNLYGERKYSQYSTLLYFGLAANLALIASIAAPISIFSGWIAGTYGPSFKPAAPVIIVLALSCLFLSLEYTTGQILISQGRPWLLLSYNALAATALVASSIYFVSRGYGALGLAYGVCTSYILKAACQACHLPSALQGRHALLTMRTSA